MAVAEVVDGGGAEADGEGLFSSFGVSSFGVSRSWPTFKTFKPSEPRRKAWNYLRRVCH